MKLYKFNSKLLIFEPIKLKMYVYTILLIGLIFSGLGFKTGVRVTNFFEKIPIVVKPNKDFCEEDFIDEVYKLKLKFPEIVIAQAKLETGNFKSKIFIQNHNLFGFKMAYNRPTLAISIIDGHAYFETWKDCLIEMAIYQQAYCKNLDTKEEYLQFLSEYYAEDSEYIDKLKKILNSTL
jgi:hypothetical protein